MDTWDGTALVGFIFGALVSALILYVVIRLAVTHAIRATRPKVAATAPRASYLDQDGL